MLKKLDFPINKCTVDITEKCNLRCKYCFTYGIGKRDLTLKQGIKTIDWIFKDEISQSDVLSLDWWGGEPFLKFDLMKRLSDYALEKANKEKKKLSIGGTSNGTLMTTEVVKWMNDHRSYFMMSIDGIKEVQDLYRPTAIKNGSSFDDIMKNLPHIIEKIPFIRTRMAPTPDTMGKLMESIKYFYNQGVRSQMFSPVFEMDWTEKDFDVAEEQMMLLADFMIETRKKGLPLDVKHLDDGALNIERNKKIPSFPCGAGRFYSAISVDGVIYPCHRFNKYDGRKWQDKAYLGTIDDGILRPEFRRQFIDFMQYPVQDKCRNCQWYGNLCDMSCYAVNFDLTGAINTPPDVYCKWMDRLGNAIRYYHKLLKVNNFKFPNISNMGGNMKGSCTCNNMCYLEGTPHEIKKLDPSLDFGCHCYNTSYSGGLNDQARSILPEKSNVEVITSPNIMNEINGLKGETSELKKSMNRIIELLEGTSNTK